jgi:CheY-like chemotaxis protein
VSSITESTNSVRNADARRRPQILLVDDDPSIIAGLQRNFHSYNIDLHVAFHGFQGVSEALAWEPDLVITDLQMPFASGEELMQCLSHIPKTRCVPIIVITGRSGVTLSKRMKSLGVTAVLEKPIQFDTLVSHIAEYVHVEKREYPPTDSNANKRGYGS